MAVSIAPDFSWSPILLAARRSEHVAYLALALSDEIYGRTASGVPGSLRIWRQIGRVGRPRYRGRRGFRRDRRRRTGRHGAGRRGRCVRGRQTSQIVAGALKRVAAGKQQTSDPQGLLQQTRYPHRPSRRSPQRNGSLGPAVAAWCAKRQSAARRESGARDRSSSQTLAKSCHHAALRQGRFIQQFAQPQKNHRPTSGLEDARHLQWSGSALHGYAGNSYPMALSTSIVRCTAGRFIMRS